MEYIYSQETFRVMVVDDEKVIREILTDFLTSEGFIVTAVESGERAMEELENQRYDVVLTDLKMPGMSGIELLEKIRDMKIDTITIMMTGFGTVETAIKAMKYGAYDYITKPFKVNEVVQIIRRGLEKQKLERENIQLKELMSLYQVSEAMSTSLSLDNILQIVLETTQQELDADAVGLILKQPPERGTQISEYMTHSLNPVDSDDEDYYGVIDEDGLFHYFQQQPYILIHGPKFRRLFKRLPQKKGLASFLSVPLKVRDELVGALNVYSYKKNYKFTDGQAKLLIILASRAAQAIENARLYENIQRTFRETIEGLVSALEAKDKYTSGHSRRVTEYALLIARALDLPEDEIERIDRAGLLHDIGKIGIRLEALNKPGKITTEEHEMFKDHTLMGKQILESIHFLREIVPLVMYHHEWWDGSGYPEGIKGEQIPLGARILAIADSYDAMTSDRPYRQAMSQDEAIAELKKYAGTQFDPALVDIFINELEKNRKMVEEIRADWMKVSFSPP
jgi:putative nucleotidyltransferase with HDIG domain